MATIVYQYGLRAPTAEGDWVREEMRRGHAYRNQLVEVERARREKERTLKESDPVVARAIEELEKARSWREQAERQVKAARRSEGGARRARGGRPNNRVETAEERERVRALRSQEKLLVRAWRRAQSDARERLKVEREAIFAARTEAHKAARASSPTGWSAREVHDDGFAQIQKMPLYDIDGAPNDPRFKRYDTGAITSRSPTVDPFPTGEAFKRGRYLQIDPVDPRAWCDDVPRGERRRLSRTMLHLEFATAERGVRKVVSWPMIMHRALPSGAEIRRAEVRMRIRPGGHEHWTVSIVVRLGAARGSGTGRVACNFGWRRLPGGDLRVAAWRGEDGAAGDIVLPMAVAEGIESAGGIEKARDEMRNGMMAELGPRLAADAARLPPWLADIVAGRDEKWGGPLAKWEAQRRFARLWGHWKDNRFDGDDAAFGLLTAWRKRDRHLWLYADGRRRKKIGWRADIYRNAAKALAERYGVLVVDDTDFAKLARRPKTEEDPAKKAAARNFTLAAPGEMRTILSQAFTVRGGIAETHEAARHGPKVDDKAGPLIWSVTRTCSKCGALEDFDRETELEHTCSRCGAHWDQDDNACANLLALPALPPPVVREAKGARIRRMAAEKKQREAAADVEGERPLASGAEEEEEE